MKEASIFAMSDCSLNGTGIFFLADTAGVKGTLRRCSGGLLLLAGGGCWMLRTGPGCWRWAVVQSWRAVSVHPRDGTGIFFLAGKASCEGTLLACQLAWWSSARRNGGVGEFLEWWLVVCWRCPSKTEQYPTMIAWYRNDHPCWLKPVAKGCCSGLSMFCVSGSVFWRGVQMLCSVLDAPRMCVPKMNSIFLLVMSCC